MTGRLIPQLYDPTHRQILKLGRNGRKKLTKIDPLMKVTKSVRIYPQQNDDMGLLFKTV